MRRPVNDEGGWLRSWRRTAVAAASEEMVAKDSRLHLSTSALAAGSTISLK